MRWQGGGGVHAWLGGEAVGKVEAVGGSAAVLVHRKVSMQVAKV